MKKENIDYTKLVNVLSQNTNLLRAYFYDGLPADATPKKKNFLETLQKKGIQLRLKILKRRKLICKKCRDVTIREVQKGVDVSLATDILRHAWQNTCNICIIVSGDEDYKDDIDVAKDKGIKIWVASFRDSLSSELERTADKVILLDKLFNDIIFTEDKSKKLI